jgi:hypothetical protein
VHKDFGYRRVHAILHKQGYMINKRKFRESCKNLNFRLHLLPIKVVDIIRTRGKWVESHQIEFIGVFGKTYCKQLKDDKDGVFLISLNSKYEPIKVTSDSSFRIFGRVLN